MLETFKVLAEPNGFQIVELLLGAPRSVGEMADQLDLAQPQVSKHLRVLRDAGLVEMRIDAQRRIYVLRPAPLKELEMWVERYRGLWEGSYDRLDAVLGNMKSRSYQETTRTEKSHKGGQR